MHDERFWLLVSRHLAGEATPQEEAELKSITEQFPRYQVKFDVILKYWGKSKQHNDAELKKAYERVRSKIDLPSRGKSPMRDPVPSRRSRLYAVRWAVAATIVFGLIIAGIFTLNQTEPSSLAWNVKVNGKGERSKILLPDGSTVWLNADSELKYPKEFPADTRQVYLEGEAFFDVAKNPDRPFTIHLEDGIVRVVGTSFNVKAFKGDDKVETSVLTGKVAFIARQASADETQNTILITPNSKVVYFKDTQKIIQLQTDSDEDTAWIDGKLIFRSRPFEEIALVLERTFGTRIVFENDALKTCRLTGTFHNNTLDEILTLLAKTNDYSYTMQNDELHISGSGCTPEP